MTSASALERCVGDVGEFALTWGQRPAVWRGADPCGFRDILSLADVDRIISTSARPPTVRMVRDGMPVELRDYCTSLRLGGKHVDDVVDPRKVTDNVRRGATLVLQSLHRTTPSVASFVAGLQHEIGHPVQANAYLTPADARGLAEHADAHDVIVLQLHGSKRWCVEESGSPGPGDQIPGDHMSGDHMLGDTEIYAGDSMYIPAGTRHRASTTGEPSLHLTLGIIRVTYRDVLQRVLRDGPDALDRPLPIGFQEPGAAQRRLERDASSMLDDVRQHLAGVDVAKYVEGAMQQRRRVPFTSRHLTALLERGDLTLDTRLRWSAPCPLGRLGPGDRWRPLGAIDAGDAPHLRIHLGDRVLTVPSVVLDAIHLLSAQGLSGGDALRVNDLPGLDPPSRIVLARRLIEETACVIDSDHRAATGSLARNPR